jgi:hypothetical protein
VICGILGAKTAEIYDSVRARVKGGRSKSASATTSTTTTAPESPETSAARDELRDGLTPEQRRMLDELG